ncbi:MAG: sulfatase-like hydrolase/transferase [Spirochaetales bacterium]|nr:sulfatase-like hydrolase/transferase [Spirochaetales bacterium]
MNSRPNILLISADQLRRDALGIYANRVIRTPHIDGLGAEGVVFDSCVCQNPYCMPSRWSIFTGRYPRSHGVRENGVLFKPEETTLATVLRDNGYRTGAFGKMHLTPQLHAAYEDEHWPADDFGFQVKHLTNDNKSGEYLDELKQKDKAAYEHVLKQGKEKIKEDLASAAERTFDLAPQVWENRIPAELHQSNWIADKFIEFLDEDRKGPFFSWVSFVDPHHPFDPPEPYASMYDPARMPLPLRRQDEFADKPEHFTRMLRGYSPGNEKYDFPTISDEGWQTIKARYYGMVSLIDDAVGRIVAKLKSLGVLENTIIVVTADHGELLGDHGILFKGPFHYDCLIRIPMIVKWGDRLCGGTRISEITQHIDLMPSLLTYAGLGVPDGVQGRFLQPLIDGDHGSAYPYALVEHDNMAWGFNIKTLRSRDWRMTYYAGRSFGELYDLNQDPHEFVNLWDDPEHRSVKEELKTALLDRLIATEDRKQRREANY